MTIYLKNKYTLQVDNFKFKCCIGKNGISKNKVEGDKKTPGGYYNIEYLYFRKDRVDKPQTSLKCIEISKNMGWCDDVEYPEKEFTEDASDIISKLLNRNPKKRLSEVILLLPVV